VILLIKNESVELGWKRPRPDFSSVIQIDGTEFIDSEIGHGKSADLFVVMMEGFEDKEILDPFLGTGATLIACERTNRVCVGIEKIPSTLAVALERFNSVGLKPQLC
jgi:hypothetical protein